MKKTYRKKKAIRRKRYSRRFVKKYYKGGDPRSLPMFFIRTIDPCYSNPAQCNKKCYLVYVGRVRDAENFEYLRPANIGDRYIKYNIHGINSERTSIITYDYQKRLWKGEVFNKKLEPMVFYIEPDDKYMMPINDDSDLTKAEITEEWRMQLRVERPRAARSDQRSDYNHSAITDTVLSPEQILWKKLQDNTHNIEFKCNVEVLKDGAFSTYYKLKTYTTSAKTIEATSIDVTVEYVELIEIYKTFNRTAFIPMSQNIPTKKAYKMFCKFSGTINETKFNDSGFCVFDGEKFLFECMQYTGNKINTIATHDYSNEHKDYHSDTHLGPFPCPTDIQISR